MAELRAYDYSEVFKHALDSVCVSLQMTLDRDDASDEPMVDMVRVEVEEELARTTALKERIEEERVLGPSSLRDFLEGRREEIVKALDFYERRLRKSMEEARQDSIDMTLKRTRHELELLDFARRSLNA